MRWQRMACWCLCWPIALTASEAAFAEEAPVSAAEVRALIRRLEQAEAKIGQLQSELQETRASQPRPFPGQATALFDDAPSQDALSSQVKDLLDQNDDLQSSHKELTEKYDGLSKDYKKLAESHEKLSGAYDKFTADVKKGKGVVLPGSSNSTVQLNGRIHADYWSFPANSAGVGALEGTPAAPMDPQDRFGFRRVRFGVKGDVGDHMLYKIEAEFAHPHEIEWRDVYIGFKELPVLQEVLVGNQKRPYGLDHINSSRYNVFLERPMVIDAFNDDSRRLGVQSYGVSEDQRWNWRYGVFLMDKIQDENAFYINDHYQGEIAGRLANTWWYDEGSDGRGYGHWAIAGTIAHPDGNGPNNQARFRARPEARTTDRWVDTGAIAGAQWYELLALEQVFNVGPVQVVGELQNVFMQRSSADNLHFWGGYAYLSYFLTGEHMPWERDSGQLGRIKPFENFFLVDRCEGGCGGGLGAWQIAARYSYLDITDGNILGGIGHNATLGLNWYWNPNARLQFNWVHGWIVDQTDLVAAGFPSAQYDNLGVRMCIDF